MSSHSSLKRQESVRCQLVRFRFTPGKFGAAMALIAALLLVYALLAASDERLIGPGDPPVCAFATLASPQERNRALTAGNTAGNPAGNPGERLQSSNFTYQGAFRLPDNFNWGALGLSYYPAGSGGSGSLLVTGFQSLSSPSHPGEACWNPAWDCFAFYGQVSIPTPATSANWESLPVARLTGGMINYDQGLVATLARENSFVSDIEFFPRTGSQTRDKIYGAANFWYPEGDFGDESFPTIWMANLDGSDARGLFHVGPRTPPFHGRKTGSFLFTAPQWYADSYLGGRRLITGRSRGTPLGGDEPVTIRGGSQGPTLFAYRALDDDAPSGNLDALAMLFYRVKFPGCAGPNIGPTAECDYPGFTMCDDWTGGAFADNGAQRAVLLLGYKGLGGNCYGNVECGDPCSAGQGYHCNPYERQVLFYDVHALGQIAQGSRDPWSVLPYEIWRPGQFYLSGNPCYNAGGMTFDPDSGRLFMVERGLGLGETNAAVVHVWQLGSGGTQWQSEVGVINPLGSSLSGILRGFDGSGNQVWTRAVNLAAHARLELDVAAAAGTTASRIKSMRLDITGGQAVGYQKFFQAGRYRVGLEALPRANQSALYLPHIHSDSQWWTGVGLVNTTAAAKSLGFAFSDGVSASRLLGPNSHDSFTIETLRGAGSFIGSAQVADGAGVAGLMLFSSERTLSGVSLSDATATSLVFPHVDQSGWWTGIGIYNPNATPTTLTITGYDEDGNPTEVTTNTVTAFGNLVFPTAFSSATAWFMVESTQPVTGFELFGTQDGNQLAGYSVVNLATTSGVFPKLERDGWTGIAFVNTGDAMATFTLEARNNAGTVMATRTQALGPKAKIVEMAEDLFPGQNIGSATYVRFTSDQPVVGFQLNGSTDGTMLDGIPALGAAHVGTGFLYFPHIHAGE